MHEQLLAGDGVGLLRVDSVLRDEYGEEKVEGTWYFTAPDVDVSW